MKKGDSTEVKSRPRQGHDINPAEVLANAPTKKARVLAYLLMPGYSLNRFEAFDIGETCLHSTISTFTNIHGLTFVHTNEKALNKWGTASDVVRYRLPDSERKQALALLALLVSRVRKPRPEVTE